MTMDINNLSRKSEIKTDVFEMQATQLQLPVKTKRSFDVAFLMLPDEKLTQRHIPSDSKELKDYKDINNLKVSKLSPQFPNYEVTNEHPPSPPGSLPGQSDDEDEEIEVDAPKIDLIKLQTQKFYTTQKQQIFGDPQLGIGKSNKLTNDDDRRQKSAFTKVNIKERLSPNLSISPDPSYQNSLSPSPPIAPRSYFQTGLMSPGAVMFKNQAYQGQFVQIPDGFQTENPFILKAPNPELLHNNFGKLRTGLSYPGGLNGYPGYPFQTQEMIKMAQTQSQLQVQNQLQHQLQVQQQHHSNHQAPLPNPHSSSHPHHQSAQPPINQHHQSHSNPAAALLSSLLPPSLAALSLPAQNVCAKCNISFRMTSDLVYHMRSHHKNEQTDYGKRKREDKLKCPVCAESFRERHHLTRHMTAHQDKANDLEMPGSKTKKFTAFGK